MNEALPKKSLGQHWLDDEATLAQMVLAGEVSKDDTILEIGPGLGSLTEQLVAQAKKVVAIEKDADLAQQLALTRPGLLSKLQIITGDILEFNLSQLPAGYKVVANIPYYLTSNLLRRLLEDKNPPCLIALMIQKEVAERITAGPGQMSMLAFSVQYYGLPKVIAIIPKELFTPAPKVDSAILQIKRMPSPVFTADTKKLFRIVKAGFAGKRKQLKNSLAAGLHLNSTECSRIIESCGISAQARAQELSLDQWQTIYLAFDKVSSKFSI